jgi:triphosphoribosyl-dephospho-CoA synthase
MPNNLTIAQYQEIGSQNAGGSRAEINTKLATSAILSLYKEVSLYPKPGLVSPVDSGSHADMNYQMFLASINSLREYFGLVADAGAEYKEFCILQKLGIQAEERMMVATRGVNTHRGAIFNIGLLCAAAGYLKFRCKTLTPEALGVAIADNWGADILATSSTKAYSDFSHGQQVESLYGVHGARHEAVTGFPAAKNYGLPAYRKAIKESKSHDAAAVQALFAMMAQLDDTNILWRAGRPGLDYVKSTSRNFLDIGGVYTADWKSRAIDIHHAFVQMNLSPGGAADLLGVTLFMNAVCD